MPTRAAHNKQQKHFVSVKLRGGLGNQMFQYAAAKALAVRWKVPLYLDKRHYRKLKPPKHRPYGLSPFRLQTLDWQAQLPLRHKFLFELLRIAMGFDRLLRRGLYQILRSIGMKRLILYFSMGELLVKKLSQALFRTTFFNDKLYSQKSFESLRPSVCLFDECWQCERYFTSIAPLIRKDFDLTCVEGPNTQPLLRKIQHPNTVSLHVRKGDCPAEAQLPLAYYEKAVHLISHLVAEPHFFVFSDEIDKAEGMLGGLLNKATYVSDPRYSMHEEMLLMSRCAHHIMANSTFSWWATWLSTPHPERYALASRLWYKGHHAPRSWYKEGEKKYAPDIFCDEWVLL